MLLLIDEGVEVEIVSVWGEYDDLQFEAIYADTGEPCSDEDYDYIYEHYATELEQMLLDKQIMRAEAAFEGDR